VKPNLSFDFRSAAVLACALLLATACSHKSSQTQTSQNRILTAPTGATVTVEPEDGQWTMPAKNMSRPAAATASP